MSQAPQIAMVANRSERPGGRSGAGCRRRAARSRRAKPRTTRPKWRDVETEQAGESEHHGVERRRGAQHALAGVEDEAVAGGEVLRVAIGDVGVLHHVVAVGDEGDDGAEHASAMAVHWASDGRRASAEGWRNGGDRGHVGRAGGKGGERILISSRAAVPLAREARAQTVHTRDDAVSWTHLGGSPNAHALSRSAIALLTTFLWLLEEASAPTTRLSSPTSRGWTDRAPPTLATRIRTRRCPRWCTTAP